jgi:hypothetical protein
MITMTSPRNTSMETNRGTCPGRIEGVLLTGATAGKPTAVTMPQFSKVKSMFHSSPHGIG